MSASAETGHVNVNPYAAPDSEVADPAVASAPEYFTVGTTKLILMSICTFGIYELWWFYKNWRVIRDRTGESIMPFWRAVFAPLWGFSFVGYVSATREALGLSKVSPVALGAAYLIVGMTWRLPDPYWLISMLTFVPLAAMQRSAHEVLVETGTADPRASRLTPLNWVALVLGGLFWVLVLLAIFVPEETVVG